MTARLPALLVVVAALAPMLAVAADAPKAVPITIRPLQVKTAAATTPTKPVAPAKPVPLPFPAPVLGPVTQDTRYATGVVTAVDPDRKTFELNTPAGRLVLTIIETSRVVGHGGQPVLFSEIAVGGSVRVYYRTGKAAEVVETDLLAAP